MNEDSGNLFDKSLDSVRKDRSKLDSILSKHTDVRAELEPVLKTAMVVESVEQPSMSAKSRQDFRQRVLSMGVVGAAAGVTAAAPRVRAARVGPASLAPGRNVLVRPRMQALVNVVVIALMLVSVVVAGTMAVPGTKYPTGQLLGELANHKYLIEGIMKNSDPKNMAKAINQNPNFLSSLVAQLPPQVIAVAINKNPEMSVKMISLLDPQAVAVPINGNG